MNAVSMAKLEECIVATFVPSDVVYKRIESYLFHTEQKDKTACADYLRLRREREEALATDGIELPEEVKRALMVRGIQPYSRRSTSTGTGTDTYTFSPTGFLTVSTSGDGSSYRTMEN